MDTVVLACTHFPLVEDELRAASPQGLHFMHGGDGIARRVQFLTEGQPWPAVAPPGIIVFTRRIAIPPALQPGLGGYGLEDRQRAVSGKWGAVRVDPGGLRILKNKSTPYITYSTN